MLGILRLSCVSRLARFALFFARLVFALRFLAFQRNALFLFAFQTLLFFRARFVLQQFAARNAFRAFFDLLILDRGAFFHQLLLALQTLLRDHFFMLQTLFFERGAFLDSRFLFRGALFRRFHAFFRLRALFLFGAGARLFHGFFGFLFGGGLLLRLFLCRSLLGLCVLPAVRTAAQIFFFDVFHFLRAARYVLSDFLFHNLYLLSPYIANTCLPITVTVFRLKIQALVATAGL